MQSVPFTTNAVSLSPAQAMCTGYNIMWYKACQWLTAGWLFSPGTPARHDITEILLKVALNTMTLTPPCNIMVNKLLETNFISVIYTIL
jgi:hypothetical protein